MQTQISSVVPKQVRPNLFDFAKSELSQDAVICWLVSYLGYDADPAMNAVARGFIELLYRKAHPDFRIEDKQVRLVPGSLIPQYQKIDVYFQLEIEGRVISFIIEDKVNTSEHSGQVERYREAIERDTRSEDEIVGIYLKTGYLFEADLNIVAKGYHIVGLEDLHAFLERFPVSNAILQDYQAAIAARLHGKNEALAHLAKPDGFEAFVHDFVQFEFMNRLAALCPQSLGAHRCYSGRNIGGAPWTQFQFLNAPGGLPGDRNDVLFYRLDAKLNKDSAVGSRGYYVSIRYYSYVKGDPAARAAKVKRLASYREFFDEARREALTPLAFAQPAADYQGANESEIALIFFDAEKNTIPAMLQHLPNIHRAFLPVGDDLNPRDSADLRGRPSSSGLIA